MSNIKRGLLVITIFVISTVVMSACTQSLSSAPAATPTIIPEGLFVSPVANGNPMEMIEEFAAQTAAAQTAAVGGGTGTPGTAENAAAGTTTATSESTEATATPTPTIVVDVSTPTNANNSQQQVQPFATSVPGSRPSTYTLQTGEFPYCIARRYNVDPDQLLSLSGLTDTQSYSLAAGTVLTIPQSGVFPGDRSLAAHPTSYDVRSSDETLYSIACKFGDVRPDDIAAANGITVSAPLTLGQKLNIP